MNAFKESITTTTRDEQQRDEELYGVKYDNGPPDGAVEGDTTSHEKENVNENKSETPNDPSSKEKSDASKQPLKLTKLKEPENLKISKLTVSGREHSLKLLTSALRSNASLDTIESSSSEIQELASKIEFHIFLKSKSQRSYKTNCFETVQDINKDSKLGKVFIFNDKELETEPARNVRGFIQISETVFKEEEDWGDYDAAACGVGELGNYNEPLSPGRDDYMNHQEDQNQGEFIVHDELPPPPPPTTEHTDHGSKKKKGKRKSSRADNSPSSGKRRSKKSSKSKRGDEHKERDKSTSKSKSKSLSPPPPTMTTIAITPPPMTTTTITPPPLVSQQYSPLHPFRQFETSPEITSVEQNRLYQ